MSTGTKRLVMANRAQVQPLTGKPQCTPQLDDAMPYYKTIKNDTEAKLHVKILLRDGYEDVSKTFGPLQVGVPPGEKRVVDLPVKENTNDMPYLNGLEVTNGDGLVILKQSVEKKNDSIDKELNENHTLTISGPLNALRLKGSNPH